MSLEDRMDALTKALNDNTNALLGRAGVQAHPAKQAAAQTKARAEVDASAKTAKAPDVKDKAVSYDDVKGPFLDLVKKDRELALATIKPFGLDNLKAAKPEQYYDILAAIKAKL
jgi:hypothetical protein